MVQYAYCTEYPHLFLKPQCVPSLSTLKHDDAPSPVLGDSVVATTGVGSVTTGSTKWISELRTSTGFVSGRLATFVSAGFAASAVFASAVFASPAFAYAAFASAGFASAGF